jgi:hypothetical protein
MNLACLNRFDRYPTTNLPIPQIIRKGRHRINIVYPGEKAAYPKSISYSYRILH